MSPFGVYASCAVGHPDCVDTQATDLTSVFVIVGLGVAVVLIAGAYAWWRRRR